MFIKLLNCLLSQNNIAYYLLAILIVVLCFVELTKRYNFRQITANMPTAYGLPLIGIAYKLVPMKKFLYVLQNYFLQLKTATFCAWLGTDPLIITVDPAIIKEVLTSENFLRKARQMYTSIDNCIPHGIITSYGQRWRHNRKLMNPSFSPQILNAFIPIFNNGANVTIAKFNTLVNSGEQAVFPILKRIILNIAMETTMGIVIQDGLASDEKIAMGFNYMLEQMAKDAVLSTVHMGFLARPPKYYRIQQFIRDKVESLIKEKYKFTATKNVNNINPTTTETRKRSEIFLNQALALHDSGSFQLDDVISETETMIAGAFETVSTTVYSVLLMLAMHPAVQERLHAELLHCLPAKDTAITLEHLAHVPYLNMVIDETLRLMPSIPVTGREATQTTFLTDNIKVPRGMQIMIPIFILHRRKDIWGATAEQFNPDNFLPEQVQQRHPYAYIPFSKGSRNCIGMRYAQLALRIILLGLVRHFRFATSFKYEELVFVEHISLRYDVEPMLVLEKRP